MKSEEIERIILIDLDNTLFNNSYNRNKASSQALSQLNLPWAKKQSSEIYKMVVTCYPVFISLGMTNFRLDWNSPEIYYVIKTLSEMPIEKVNCFYGSLSQLYKQIKLMLHGTMWDNSKINILTDQVINEWRTLGFNDAYLSLKNDKNIVKEVTKAVDVFYDTILQMTLKDNVKEFLNSLKKANIVSFIVSEGYKEQQLQKISILGLLSFFKDEDIFILEEKTIKNYISLLYKIVEKTDRCIKLVVIGDRYDKDIHPLISILGKKIFTIHLRSGKYRGCYSKKILDQKRFPNPAMTIRNLVEATPLLIKDKFWDSLPPICTKSEIDHV